MICILMVCDTWLSHSPGRWLWAFFPIINSAVTSSFVHPVNVYFCSSLLNINCLGCCLLFGLLDERLGGGHVSFLHLADPAPPAHFQWHQLDTVLLLVAFLVEVEADEGQEFFCGGTWHRGKGTGSVARQTWGRITVLMFPSCRILVKLCNLFQLQFPCLTQKTEMTYLKGLLWGLQIPFEARLV